MARRGRGASRAAASAARRRSTPLPNRSDPDDDMPDAQEQSTPPEFPNDDNNLNDASSPAPDSEPAEEASNPPTPLSQPLSRRGRRPGRARGRPPLSGRAPQTHSDLTTPEPGAENDNVSDGATPRRRGRLRGSVRGVFRGRAKWMLKQPPVPTRQTIDKEGTSVAIVDDESVLPPDLEGETKVDANGYLLAGRDYRVRVFTIAGRGPKLYMLSTEPARCTGFRDSYLFFARHMVLVKIILDDEEKRDLIERDLMPHSYKGRSIGVVTARSVFREFGARIVIGGRKVTDDYQVAAARERGDIEGELADPNDRLPSNLGEAYNKNQYVAWHGASSVYHQAAPGGPGGEILLPGAKPVFSKRSKAVITGANWMYEHVRAASVFNSQLSLERRKVLGGVYDVHANIVGYPAVMQPTMARWDAVALSPVWQSTINISRNEITNGSSGFTNDPHMPDSVSSAKKLSTTFPPLPPLISRNFLVVDTYLETPPHASLPTPGLTQYLDLDVDGDAGINNGTRGLPALDEEDLAGLDEECRTAYLARRELEHQWREKWRNEAVHGLRGQLRIGVGGV